ncbi:MAG: peptidyl-prolyl cis-trans isomerase [Candidatus Latescibacterota bacterium]
MGRSRVVWVGLVALALGCGTLRDPVVAKVGPTRITASDLRTYVQGLPSGLLPRQTGDEARRHCLQSLIDGRLLLMEARALGLDTTRAVREQVREAVDARVRHLYRTRQLTSRIEVTAAEVEDYYRAEGFDRQRRFGGILVDTRAQLDTVLAELEGGRPFAEVARARSRDARSARQGGELGFIGREMASRVHVPPEVFRSLPPGEVSGPLPAGQRWHVVRFTEERPVAFEACRERVQQALFEERVREAETRHLEGLRESFEVRVHGPGLQEVVDAYRGRDLGPLRSGATLVYAYRGGQVTAGQVAERLVKLRVESGFADSAQAANTLSRLVLSPLLVQEAARRAGYYGEDEVRQFERRKAEDVLLEALKAAVITSGLVVTEAEVRRYYDAHPEVFTQESAVWAEELLLATEEEARAVRAQIEAGAAFAELAERSLRPKAAQNRARFHLHPREKALYPRLFPLVMASRPGELVGPAESDSGYSVFRVLGHEPQATEPYERARRRAQAVVRLEREGEALQAYVANLRHRYTSAVQVFETRLAEAVPDSLLQRG